LRAAENARPGMRIAWIQAVLLLAFLGLAARAGHLVIEERARDRGQQQTTSVIRIPPARGTVYDRELRELAVTVTAPSVYAIPSEMEDPTHQARFLAKTLGMDSKAVVARLANREGYTFIKRWVTPEQAKTIEQKKLPGIGLIDEPRRAYPAGAIAGRVIGFTNIDGRGVRGIEQQEDDFLRGKTYSVEWVRDARGRKLGQPVRLDTSAGGEIALTLDAALQADAEIALEEAVQKTGAKGGAILSMIPSTGEIQVVAEAPRIDPNGFRDLSYDSTGLGAFLDATEPGSTMKVFLTSAALDAGTLEVDDVIDCSGGSYRVPGKIIRDHRDYGILDPAQVLWHSSNVGSVQIAQDLGPEEHYHALRRFGFGTSTGSGFPHESSGLLRGWQDWKPVDHATIAFGQGISVTMVQLAAATAALANGGEWLTPRLIKARRSSGGRWKETPVERVRQAVSPETARAVLDMMRGVVSSEGTGRLAGLRDVSVAGKTGTAQKLDPETGAYAKNRYLAWFIGAVPADDPEFVIVVVLDEPKGLAHGGGDVAAPLFAKVATTHLARVGIVTAPKAEPRLRVELAQKAAPPKQHEPAPRAVARAASPEPPATRLGDRILLPDLRGLSRDEVTEFADSHSLELRSEGRGRAFEQVPAPGTILAGPRARILVRFRTGSREG